MYTGFQRGSYTVCNFKFSCASYAVLTKADGQIQNELQTHSNISQVLKIYNANDQLRAQDLRYQ